MVDTSRRTGSSPEDTPPWLDAREHRAWRAFLTMKDQLDARLASELRQDSGLSSADFAVLVGVSEAPQRRIRAHVLCATLLWEKSRLSKQISRMEARGLVERQSCPSDARGSFIVLTPLGLDTIERAAATHVRRVRAAFFDVLSADQIDQLSRIAEDVIAHLGCPDDATDTDVEIDPHVG